MRKRLGVRGRPDQSAREKRECAEDIGQGPQSCQPPSKDGALYRRGESPRAGWYRIFSEFPQQNRRRSKNSVEPFEVESAGGGLDTSASQPRTRKVEPRSDRLEAQARIANEDRGRGSRTRIADRDRWVQSLRSPQSERAAGRLIRRQGAWGDDLKPGAETEGAGRRAPTGDKSDSHKVYYGTYSSWRPDDGELPQALESRRDRAKTRSRALLSRNRVRIEPHDHPVIGRLDMRRQRRRQLGVIEIRVQIGQHGAARTHP